MKQFAACDRHRVTCVSDVLLIKFSHFSGNYISAINYSWPLDLQLRQIFERLFRTRFIQLNENLLYGSKRVFERYILTSEHCIGLCVAREAFDLLRLKLKWRNATHFSILIIINCNLINALFHRVCNYSCNG